MIGFRSTVQGLLPILPSRVRRIGIFCFTHRCCPVLLPAGSIRSSSLVSRYEDCFKPMALQVPGYPLRPYRSASGFSGLCGSTCWRKTGKNCISHGHSWKLAYLLRTFEGATAMSILGWWRLAGTPLPAEIRNCRDTKLWYTESSSLDISHIESEAAWNRNPQRWKFPLRSWEPCESSASKLGLGSWNLGNTRLLHPPSYYPLRVRGSDFVEKTGGTLQKSLYKIHKGGGQPTTKSGHLTHPVCIPFHSLVHEIRSTKSEPSES